MYRVAFVKDKAGKNKPVLPMLPGYGFLNAFKEP